jgi:hypothetical protein
MVLLFSGFISMLKISALSKEVEFAESTSELWGQKKDEKCFFNVFRLKPFLTDHALLCLSA